MSFLGSIGSALSGAFKAVSSVVTPILGAGLSAVGSVVGGPIGGIVGGVAGQAVSGLAPRQGAPQHTGPPVTTAGMQAGGILQTLPQLGGGQTLPALATKPGGGTMNAPAGQTQPGFFSSVASSLGAAAGQAIRGGVAGSKVKRGKLTGNLIPAGFVEKMSPSGVVYLGKHRRRRGISARDISSFYRVHRLVAKIRSPIHHRRGK